MMRFRRRTAAAISQPEECNFPAWTNCPDDSEALQHFPWTIRKYLTIYHAESSTEAYGDEGSCKGIRAWAKNTENLNPQQFSLWRELDVKRLNLKAERAYDMRLAFQEFLYLGRRQCRGTPEALVLLGDPQPSATIDAAHTNRRHWDGALNRFKAA
jgi:hypothetical protein